MPQVLPSKQGGSAPAHVDFRGRALGRALLQSVEHLRMSLVNHSKASLDVNSVWKRRTDMGKHDSFERPLESKSRQTLSTRCSV